MSDKALALLLTLSNPFSSSLFPSTSPTPAKSVTGFSPMGSATKFLCFCDVLDIMTQNLQLLSLDGEPANRKNKF